MQAFLQIYTFVMSNVAYFHLSLATLDLLCHLGSDVTIESHTNPLLCCK